MCAPRIAWTLSTRISFIGDKRKTLNLIVLMKNFSHCRTLPFNEFVARAASQQVQHDHTRFYLAEVSDIYLDLVYFGELLCRMKSITCVPLAMIHERYSTCIAVA